MKVLLTGHTLGFHPDSKIQNHLVQDNKQYHRKVLLCSFYLNGHSLHFHPQTQKSDLSLREYKETFHTERYFS